MAIGNPVAFDASADERDTRGFISMMTMSPLVGSSANCTFEPPVSTPTRRMHAKAASRIIWYSTSLSVCAGATVIESPVCTPIGSRFSIEQMITQLSARSRMTSSSYSFHPAIDRSMRISLTGLASRPYCAIRSNSSGVVAMPVPLPPRMKAGRMTTGRPMRSITSCASSMSWATPLGGTWRPMPCMACLKISRSSAVRMASALAPISSGVPSVPTAPRSTSSMARLSAVWPPRVGSTASGRSRSMILQRMSASSGST